MNWEDGISRSSAAFFVQDNKLNSINLKVGKRVSFGRSNIRTIIRVERFPPYLNIYLTGGKLDPKTTGHPNEFKILD